MALRLVSGRFRVGRIDSLSFWRSRADLCCLLDYTILYYIILYSSLVYSTLLYTILFYTILYCTVLYSTIPYHTILFYPTLAWCARRFSGKWPQASPGRGGAPQLGPSKSLSPQTLLVRLLDPVARRFLFQEPVHNCKHDPVYIYYVYQHKCMNTRVSVYIHTYVHIVT